MSKPLVLVVEDSDVMCFVATSNLERYADVEVRVAKNGVEAVEQFKRDDFALILMDVNLPEMDGLEATRVIRDVEKESGKRTPIVGVTAAETRQRCLEAGMDDFASKPADYKRIVEMWLPTTAHRFSM